MEHGLGPETEEPLQGRVAIVTGATRGIGREEALHLAASGALVVVNGRGAEDVADLVRAIEGSGGTALGHVGDVSDWAKAEELVALAIERFGHLDVLVNNAGIIRDAMSFSMTEEDWDEVVRVNLKGHFAPVHFAAIHWRAQAKAAADPAGVRGGCVINTTSEAGLFGLTGQLNYVATKAGIAALTLSLSKELAPYGVAVNAVAPRARTRMTTEIFERLGVPLEPPLEGFDEWSAANVAPVVSWLATEAARSISGKVFVVFANKVWVVSPWTPGASISTTGRWRVGDLLRRQDELLAGA